MTARSTRGEQTRTHLLDAAAEVMIESGPEGFSLREVARRAGLAPSAVYNHFANREELVIATAIAAVGQLCAALAPHREGTPVVERLTCLARAYVGFAARHPVHYRLIFDCLPNPPGTWEHYLQVAQPFTWIVEACEAGVASGELDGTRARPDAMAYALWTLCHGHASLTARHLSTVDGPFDELFATSVNTLLSSYRKD